MATEVQRSDRRCQDVLEKNRKQLRSHKNVIALGWSSGMGFPQICVYTDGPVTGIPKSLEDIPVQVVDGVVTRTCEGEGEIRK